MKPNVFIRGRKHGKLFYSWEGHNTWTEVGRTYLARMMAYQSLSPDVPFETKRLKHMAFGIGGNLQSMVIDPVADTAYPAGADPNATNGKEYNHLYPIEPLISTLERPVRISGGSNPYATAAPTDVWATDPTPPKFLVTNPAVGQVTVRFFIEPLSGDLVYAPFTEIPLSEAGLMLSDVDVNEPFEQVIAYVNFATLLLVAQAEVEVTWNINF